MKAWFSVSPARAGLIPGPRERDALFVPSGARRLKVLARTVELGFDRVNRN